MMMMMTTRHSEKVQQQKRFSRLMHTQLVQIRKYSGNPELKDVKTTVPLCQRISAQDLAGWISHTAW